MPAEREHRKQIRHYDEPGHFHELTFSCYRRMPLLTNDVWRAILSASIDRALKGNVFRLIAFVYMAGDKNSTGLILCGLRYVPIS